MVQKGLASGLRPREIVEVRTKSEIISTLEKDCTLEGLPFIAEMERYCGRRFEVLKVLRKIKVEVPGAGMRRIRNTVILKGAECNGQYHGNCNRTCILLWKEAWLKRVPNEPEHEQSTATNPLPQIESTISQDGPFSCQSTNLQKATTHIPFWDIRQYLWDISSGTYRPMERFRGLLTSLNFTVQGFLGDKRNIEWWTIPGKLRKTPSATLDLQPGEIVRVRSKEEILATLDSKGRNRGLAFTADMLKYCNGKYRVLKRLAKMINEGTGKMRPISNTVLLEGVTCDGKNAGGCQRTCHCLWREIWLERVETKHACWQSEPALNVEFCNSRQLEIWHKHTP
jgi:hypothetical protein